jgi:two-component system KDP operon response regulator KdpE
MSGIEFLELFRQWSQSPVIILSARGDESAKVMALDCGADDYLTKPFRIPELQARLRVALRHANRQTGSSNTPIYQNGGLQVDLDKRRVTLHGEDLHLTPIEYRLLAVLVRHSGAVVTHQVLMREVWGEAYVNETHYLRVYMRQLRQKLDDDGSKPRYLETATRIGYRLRDEAPAA